MTHRPTRKAVQNGQAPEARVNRRVFANRFSTFVISLERTPQRLAQFRTWNDPCDIEISHFKGIDGRDLDPAKLEPSFLVPGTKTYGRGTLGLVMSHSSLWRRCAEGNKPFLIFEDDVAIRRDIRAVLPALVAALPEGWEMLAIGYNVNTVIETALAPGVGMRLGFTRSRPTVPELMRFAAEPWPVGLVRLSQFFGTCAYLISPKGGAALLRRCLPLDSRNVNIPAFDGYMTADSLDVRINAHLREIRAYASVPPLVMPQISPETSVRVSAETADM
jgi:GR25 family glycosyltransferase involved in LPS biosynthesis